MLRKLVIYQILLILLMSASCDTNDHQDKHTNTTSNKSQKESLIKVNKYLVNAENTEIDNYIRRHNLDVVETGSGLKYQIIKHGEGEIAAVGKVVSLIYKVKLITGDVIYSSDQSGQKHFEIGHGGVESGLEEAILTMRVGDEAIIIIPSHLAFGLLGDKDKIPRRSTVIYEVELVNINNKIK